MLSVKCGVWSGEFEVWSVMWEVKCGVRSVEWNREVWSVECEACAECGVRSAKCGAESVKCDMLSDKCGVQCAE